MKTELIIPESFVKRTTEIRTTLARKWLKTPHNRFKMWRRRCKREKIIIDNEDGFQAKDDKEAFDENLKKIFGTQIDEDKSSSIINTRSHLTTTTITKRQFVPVKIKIMILLVASLILTISCFIPTAKMAPPPSTKSQLASQELRFTSTPTSGQKIPTSSRSSIPSTSSPSPSPLPPPPPTTITTTYSSATKTSAPTTTKAIRQLPVTTQQAKSLPQTDPIKRHRLEEEVSLVSGSNEQLLHSTEQTPTSAASFGQRQRSINQKPHLIRIQAALNGKLVGPARVEVGNYESDQVQAIVGSGNGSVRANTGRQEVLSSLVATGGDEMTTMLPQTIWKPVNPQVSPSSTQSSESLIQTLEPITPTVDTNEPCQQQQQQQQSGENDDEVQHNTSIDTSSQMLRLTAAPAGSRPQARTQLISSAGGSEQSGKLDLMASLSQQNLHPQSTLAATAQPFVPLLQQQQVDSSIARMSLATKESAASVVNEQQQQQQRQLANFNGGESILSLVDDYDSKIITNRTKGKFFQIDISSRV